MVVLSEIKYFILSVLEYAGQFFLALIALAAFIGSITATIIGFILLCNTGEFNWWLPGGVIAMALMFGIANVGDDWGWW